MLTYLPIAADTGTTVDDDAWAERREALRIRPLLDDARLRAALGLTQGPPPVVRRTPVGTGAPATHRPTKHAALVRRERFDRRALLESDR